MFMKPELKQMLDRIDKFYIYGLGKYAKLFYELCKKHNYSDKIKAVVLSVTNDYMPKTYKNAPVISVCDVKDIDTPVFITSSRAVLCDIKRNLIQIGSKNMIYALDYVGGAENEQNNDPFLFVSFKDFCASIATWYVAVNDKYDDFDKITQDIYNIGYKRKTQIDANKKSLTYITCNVDSRDYKILSALKKTGYSIDIIWLSKNGDSVSASEFANSEISVRRCLYEEEALYYALKSGSYLFMIDEASGYANSYVIRHILEQREYFGKIIFFPYDVCIGTYTNYPLEYYISERYAMENSDGVITRYVDNINYLKEKFNVNFKGETLIFFDYCEEIKNLPKENKSEKLKIAHVASHLNMVLERDLPNKEYSYNVPVDDILKIVGNRPDCQFDLFVWSGTEKELEHIEELKKQYANFHFHLKTEHNRLLNELQNFDYLTDLYSNRKIQKWPVELEGYSENTMLYGMCNRYFDAISAGIPVIANVPVKIVEYLEKMGVMVNMTFEELDIEYLKANKQKYKKNALKAREELMINNHIHKFSELLDAVRLGRVD